VNIKDIKDYDISAKNPNKNKEGVLRDPKEIIKDIEDTDNEIEKLVVDLKKMI
jgi:type I restriction enzyme M protein